MKLYKIAALILLAVFIVYPALADNLVKVGIPGPVHQFEVRNNDNKEIFSISDSNILRVYLEELLIDSLLYRIDLPFKGLSTQIKLPIATKIIIFVPVGWKEKITINEVD